MAARNQRKPRRRRARDVRIHNQGMALGALVAAGAWLFTRTFED